MIGPRQTLATCLVFASSEVLTGSPLDDERAALDDTQSFLDGVSSHIVYHSERVRDSGVNENSNTARLHQTVCETLLLLRTNDLTHVPNLAAGKQLTRRLIQTDLVTMKDPRHPGFTCLDTATGTVIRKSGRAKAGQHNTWLAELRLRGKGGGADGGKDTSDKQQGDDQRSKGKRKRKGTPEGVRRREALAKDSAIGASGGQ